MKKATRSLAMLLCMCILMGIMATAASAVTILTIINLSVDAPVVGKAPSLTASVPSSAHSTVEKVEWSGQLDSNGTFKAGVRYKVTVTMGIKKGADWKFSSKSITAKVNGQAADEVLWYSNNKVEVIYTFPAVSSTTPATSTAKAINAIYLTVDAPGTGKKPATTASLTAGSNGTVNSVVKDVKWSGELDIDGTFMCRVKYKVTFTMGIKPGANYYFPDKDYSIAATVNGNAADEIVWYANDHVEVTYTFPAFGTGNTLTFAWINMDGPAVGEKPAATAHLGSTASTYVSNVRWEGALDSNGCFQGGTVYTAYLTLRVKPEYTDRKFSTKSFDAYVNGVLIGEVTRNSDTEIVVPVVFEKTEGAQVQTRNRISTIYLTVDAPGTGKKPAATASLSADSNGTVNSAVKDVKWSGELDIDGTFMCRVKYKVTFTMGIEPGANYYFPDEDYSIAATVNGNAADEIVWYADDHVDVTYTFPAFGTDSTLTFAWINMDGPAAGEKPAATAHLGSTASTYVSNIRWEGALDSNGCFQGGTVYTAYLTLRVKPEYTDRKFSSKNFDAYVNGVLMNEVTWLSDNEIVIPVEFENTPGSAPAATSFIDVPADAYFAQPVQWAVGKNITAGVSKDLFGPEQTCTQAQILTFLWRAAGSPKPQGTVVMEGFDGTEYYYQAAMWAAEQNMVGGNFAPDAPCTRAMAVNFMWKHAGSPAAAPASFIDVPADADYSNAVGWAVAKGVTSGTGNDQFSPTQTCTRAQIVSFLYRAFAN